MSTLGVAVLGLGVKEDLSIGESTVQVPHPAGGVQSGIQINISSFGRNLAQAWAPAALGPLAAVTVNLVVPGALVRHPVVASFDGSGFIAQGRLVMSAKVYQADGVAVTVINTDPVNTLALGSGTLRVSVLMFPTSF